MVRRLTVVAAVLMSLVVVPTASARSSHVDRIDGIETVLAVALPDNFPVGSLSRADCAFTQIVTRPDGTAMEAMHCQLSDRPVMIPEFQGTAPEVAFHLSGGPCEWVSDYWFAKDGSIVFAERFQTLVTPSGRVLTQAWYPAEPLVCG